MYLQCLGLRLAITVVRVRIRNGAEGQACFKSHVCMGPSTCFSLIVKSDALQAHLMFGNQFLGTYIGGLEC